MSARPPLGPGDVVAGQRLRGLLGRGAHGEVWAASPLVRPDQRVAIKLLAAPASQRPRVTERFLHEASIARDLAHPNVCRAFEAGTEGDVAYLVLEWIDGVSLGELLALTSGGEPLDTGLLLGVAIDAAAGLHAAHELRAPDGTPLGVVHRDVTARNLLIGCDGVTRVSDFGIARSQKLAVQTTTGVVRGTLRTVAPEQAIGAAVDRRADVWSLCAVLFDALAAGAPAFRRAAEGPLFAELAVAGPSLWATTRAPPALTAVLRRGLARHPDARPRTAAALGDELTAAAARDRLDVGRARIAARVASLAASVLAERRASFADDA